MPRRLRLLEPRPQRPVPGTNTEAAESTRDVHVGHGRNDGGGQHRPNARTVARVAQAYCDNPSLRHRSLNVDGCEGDTYATCIRQLRNGPPDDRLTGGILFAPIRFRGVEFGQGNILLRLDRWRVCNAANGGGWMRREYYHIKFETENWPDRTKIRFRNELTEWLAAQEANYRGGWKKNVYIFFLGRVLQDAAQIVVDRYQYFDFLELDKDRIGTL